MKYRKEEILESNILDNDLSNYKIAKLVGCNHSYISLLRREKRIAPYSFYLKLQKALDNTVNIE